MSTPEQKSYLILGWQVNSILDPQYWRDASVKPGSPNQESYLFKVPAEAMASHTAIIAQSGSGKSFFLGRLVEELVLRTKSRCIILDPNADFKRIYEIEPDRLWSEARYDLSKRRGKLPHEASREEFEKQWSKIPVRIRGNDPPSGNYEALRLWWPSLSVEFLGEDLDPMLRSDLYHCHALVQALEILLKGKAGGVVKDTDLFPEAQKMFGRARKVSEDELRAELVEEFVPKDSAANAATKKPSYLPKGFFKWLAKRRTKRIQDSIERIVATPKYVSVEVERFYFGKVRAYMATRILDTVMRVERSNKTSSKRIEVMDLPSLSDKGTRLLAINAMLTAEWEEARKAWDNALKEPQNQDKRVPTFIVVDEAHNLIPIEPSTKAETALRDQFRTIIAEGRKYGLFLILVSQRPDKLDPLILSECENRAVMKLGSASVLAITRGMLGLEDLSPRLLEKCLEFETGRVLLVGRWSPQGPQITYSAARRTVEGGRNLRDEYWAVPAETEDPPDAKPTK